jgi:hypothetical protein
MKQHTVVRNIGSLEAGTTFTHFGAEYTTLGRDKTGFIKASFKGHDGIVFHPETHVRVPKKV